MKRLQHTLAIAAIGIATTLSATAMGLTREQVQAELREAIRMGDLIVGEHGQTLREMYPSRYPARPVEVGKTRAQVRAELAEAIRTGDMVADADSGLKFNEINPSLYPAIASQPGKTRAQVRAELQEAIRTGDILAGGEQGLKLNELFPHRYPRPTQTTDKGASTDVSFR